MSAHWRVAVAGKSPQEPLSNCRILRIQSHVRVPCPCSLSAVAIRDSDTWQRCWRCSWLCWWCLCVSTPRPAAASCSCRSPTAFLQHGLGGTGYGGVDPSRTLGVLQIPEERVCRACDLRCRIESIEILLHCQELPPTRAMIEFGRHGCADEIPAFVILIMNLPLNERRRTTWGP